MAAEGLLTPVYLQHGTVALACSEVVVALRPPRLSQGLLAEAPPDKAVLCAVHAVHQPTGGQKRARRQEEGHGQFEKDGAVRVYVGGAGLGVRLHCCI